MPGLKPKASQRPAQPKKPRKPRPHGFARTRMTPTQRVEHVVEECPNCGTQLSGGWTQRTREVINLPQVPIEVTEHVYMARNCGTQLSGGWTQRTREVINLPQVPIEVTEHVYMARTCPLCRRCCVPPAQLDGVVMGKQRLRVNLVSLIVALRERRPGCRSAPSSSTWTPCMGCAPCKTPRTMYQ